MANIELLPKYGRLKVIDSPFRKFTSSTSKQKRTLVAVLCDCGTKFDAVVYQLKNGHTKSCGCLKIDLAGSQVRTHGLCKHPIYTIWNGIKRRCYNKNDPAYERYGGRGITVCDEWRNDFQVFYDWCIANGWKKGLDIDRFPNNDGNYEPSNCRFSTRTENNRNKRGLKLNELKVRIIRKLQGEFTCTYLAELFGVSVTLISYVFKNKIWND